MIISSMTTYRQVLEWNRNQLLNKAENKLCNKVITESEYDKEVATIWKTFNDHKND